MTGHEVGHGASRLVGVVGAGAMGSGIAQVAVTAGDRVRLYDTAPGAAERAVAAIGERLRSLVAKGRIELDLDAVDLAPVDDLAAVAAADVVLEAIVEDLGVKRDLFAELDRLAGPAAMLGTNTSSLSPTAVAGELAGAHRVIGMHFFNPAPLMRLVEVIPGARTDAAITDEACRIVEGWGKTVARCTATPGFIVNRIARPFYGEAWRLIEEGATTPATIDAVLTGAGGFRMGPCALMDLVGHDVNDAVTRSVWTAFGYDRRFAPSPGQRTLIEAGRLGRKSGQGLFDHSGGGQAEATAAVAAEAPIEVTAHGEGELATLLKRSGVAVLDGEGSNGTVELPSGAVIMRCGGRSAAEMSAELGSPVVLVDRTLDDLAATAVAIAASPGCTQRQLDETIGLLQSADLAVFPVADTPGLIVARTVAMLVNFAVDALLHGVATPADIDIAMELGTNYPLGPLAWGDRWGPATVLSILDDLVNSDGDPRYRASSLLRRVAAARATFR